MIDVKKALADPGLVFNEPKDVVTNSELSLDQKIAILRQWELDARRIQIADEEGMTGSRPTQLQAVIEALRSLETR